MDDNVVNSNEVNPNEVNRGIWGNNSKNKALTTLYDELVKQGLDKDKIITTVKTVIEAYENKLFEEEEYYVWETEMETIAKEKQKATGGRKRRKSKKGGKRRNKKSRRYSRK